MADGRYLLFVSANGAHTSTIYEDGSAKCGEECGEEHDIVWHDVGEELEQASTQSIPKMQEVGGGALLTSGIASSARARNRSHHWAHYHMRYSDGNPAAYS